MSNPKEKLTRYALGLLLLFIAINAFGGGYYGMAGAKDIPVDWLKGSPFHSYFFPGLILFVSVGGSALLASILVLKHSLHAQKGALACGSIVLGWLIVQVAIIGYVSWLQPVIGVAAISTFLLTWKLSKYEQ